MQDGKILPLSEEEREAVQVIARGCSSSTRDVLLRYEATVRELENYRDMVRVALAHVAEKYVVKSVIPRGGGVLDA